MENHEKRRIYQLSVKGEIGVGQIGGQKKFLLASVEYKLLTTKQRQFHDSELLKLVT